MPTTFFTVATYKLSCCCRLSRASAAFCCCNTFAPAFFYFYSMPSCYLCSIHRLLYCCLAHVPLPINICRCKIWHYERLLFMLQQSIITAQGNHFFGARRSCEYLPLQHAQPCLTVSHAPYFFLERSLTFLVPASCAFATCGQPCPTFPTPALVVAFVLQHSRC